MTAVEAGPKPVRWHLSGSLVIISLLAAEFMSPLAALGVAALAFGLLALTLWRFVYRWNPVDILPLGLLLVVGLLGTLVGGFGNTAIQAVNFQRDILILLSYIVAVAIGQWFAGSGKFEQVFWRALVLSAVVVAVVHLLRFGIALSSGITDLNSLRLEAGRGSFTEFAGVISIFMLKSLAGRSKLSAVQYLALTLILLSLIASLSRGLLISVALLGLFMATSSIVARNQLLAFNISKIAYLAASSVVVLFAAYFALWIALPQVAGFLDKFFFAKVLQSWTEVSSTQFLTSREIAANYRAFEADRAIAQFENHPIYAQFIGQGWGTVVEFGVETASTTSDFSRTNAAFLHNGYVNFLVKSGFLGVLAYIFFLARFLRIARSGRVETNRHLLGITKRKFLFVVVIAVVLGSLTTGGLGYPASYLAMAMLLGACSMPSWALNRKTKTQNRRAPVVMPTDKNFNFSSTL